MPESVRPDRPSDSVVSAATKRTCPVAWCWKAEPCPDHAAKPATTAATLADRLRELHRPWYEISGVRHDHTVCIYSDDVGAVGHDHVCRVGFEWDNCDPENEQHYALACIECRQTTEDGDPAYPIWPCATIRAVEEAESA